MNNIMKKGLLLLTTAFIAQFASAGLLLWSVDTDSVSETYTDYSYAVLYSYADGSDSSSASAVYSYVGNSESTYQKIGSSSFLSTVAASVTDVAGYSFYVELYNTSATLLATSSTVDGDTLTNYYYANNLLDSLNGASTWTLTSNDFTAAVPEPTGGLLILMGAAVLGLRRKRMA